MKELNACITEMILERLEIYNIKDNVFMTAFYLFKEEISNDSVLYDKHATQEWIGKYFSEISEIIEEYKSKYKSLDVANPFLNPEHFMVQIVILVTKKILENVWEEGITKSKLIDKLEKIS